MRILVLAPIIINLGELDATLNIFDERLENDYLHY